MQFAGRFLKGAIPFWIGLAFVLAVFAFLLRYFNPHFSSEVELIDMPVATFVATYCVVALMFVLVLPRTVAATQLRTKGVLFIVFSFGLILRLAMLGTPTILEDDYNRYLWDGAVTANGKNPYAYSPQQIAETAKEGDDFYKLKEEAGPVFDNINYPEFSTVYPPATQVLFAIAYRISPFDLDAFRVMLFIFEIGCAILILAILANLNKSPLWLAVYWWNPLVLKEVGNSAHMEPFLMLPVLMACFLVLKGRLIFSSAMLAVAAGVKVWPALLILPIWRQLLISPKKLLISGSVFGFILGLMILPIVLAGLKSHSGFAAFGGQWQASSAAYLVAQFIADLVWPFWLDTFLEIPQVARLLLVVGLICFISLTCLRATDRKSEILKRMFLITAAIYILSPSNAPWYFIWIAPFLCVYPFYGLMLAGAMIPLHYSFFHFSSRGMADFYHDGIVWLIWLPVWGVLVIEFLKTQRSKRLQKSLA